MYRIQSAGLTQISERTRSADRKHTLNRYLCRPTSPRVTLSRNQDVTGVAGATVNTTQLLEASGLTIEA